MAVRWNRAVRAAASVGGGLVAALLALSPLGVKTDGIGGGCGETYRAGCSGACSGDRSECGGEGDLECEEDSGGCPPSCGGSNTVCCW